LSGLDYFGTIVPSFQRQASTGALSLDVPPKPYGRNSLQIGLSLQDDFQGDSAYSLTLRHLLLAANRMGGEWQNILQIGESQLLTSEFIQPLDPKMRWFVAPAVFAHKINQGLWQDGEQKSQYRIKTFGGAVGGGYVLGNWGEIRAGAYRSRVDGNV